MFKIRFTEESEKQLFDLRDSKNRQLQFKVVAKVIGYMKINLRHPSLNTH